MNGKGVGSQSSTQAKRPFERIVVESLGEIARLTINRPRKLNAIDAKTRQEITSALDSIGKSKGTRCLILTGAGGRAFSSGEDLKETYLLRNVSAWTREWTKFLSEFMTLPQPIVTASSGYAVGAGWQIFLLGDYRICSPEARFALPEVNVGLPSIMGAAILRTISGGFAQIGRITLLGESIDAKDAMKMGLVHDVVPQRSLQEAALRVARKLARKPLTSLLLQRAWMQKSILDAFREGVANASSIYAVAFESEEAKEKILHFVNRKRLRRPT